MPPLTDWSMTKNSRAVRSTIEGCILWSAAYVVLLVVAVIGNHGLGGPLAFPAGIIAVIATCVSEDWRVQSLNQTAHRFGLR